MAAVLTRVRMVVSRAGMRVRMRVLVAVRMAVGGLAVRVCMGMCVPMRVRAYHDAPPGLISNGLFE